MRMMFYKITNVNNKINKTIPDTPTLQIDGILKDDCDILNPKILIEKSGVPDYNYVHIPEFGRYYFMAPAVSVKNNFWEIPLHVDVLFTYRQQILTAPCIVAKSTSNYNLYLDDSNYKCYANPYIFAERWPSGFNVENAHFIMSLFGDKVLAT